MGKKEDFDVVIIGSGVSGLVCGCYLQKAGLKVAILEAREEAGGGRITVEPMRPGCLVQPCVFGDIEPIMMHQLNLELDKYGYQEIEVVNEWGWGYLFEDGTCLANHPWDIRKFAQKVEHFSKKDADKILEIGGYLAEPYDDKSPRSVKLAELMLSEPWTWENFDKLVNLAAPLLPFDDPYEITDINGFELMDLIFESEQVKVFFLSFAIGMAAYPFYTGGAAAIAALFYPLGGITFHPKNGIHSMAHVYIRCFRALGGKLFNCCPVSKIMIAGGEAKGVVLDDFATFPGKEITAKKVVSNLNPRLTFTELVGEEHVGKRVIQKLKTNWKGDGVLVSVTFALKERPRFVAEKYDPDIALTMAGKMGEQTVSDVIHGFGERMAGRISDKPMVSYAFAHRNDTTQNGPGKYFARTDFEVPYAIHEKGGAKAWDDNDFRKQVIEKFLYAWETHFPGFRKNVLDYRMNTPLDHVRMNPNYLRGCYCGGSPYAHQMTFGNRAAIEGFDKGGVVTPIKNLYGSGSVSLAGSNGGGGYVAACHIAEELGIRNQPWWTHRVYEYIIKKFVEKNYVPLKPTSILDK